MKGIILSGIAVLGLTFCQARAYDFVSGGVAYDILSNTQTRKTVGVTYITTDSDASGYVSTYRGDMVIPAQVTWNMETFNVTRIGDLAMFNNQGLYTLRLPEGISSIGSQAFSHCYSLYEINVPMTVSRVADYAFEYCEDLTTITFPAKLQEFGDGVFNQCYGLERVNVDPECTEFKSIDGVMYGRLDDPTGMRLIVYPGSGPSEFIMPDNVGSLDDYAFSANSRLRSLTLSKALRKLNPDTFFECAVLEAVNVPEDSETFLSEDGVLFDKGRELLIYYPVAKSSGSFEVPEGVEKIGGMSMCQVNALRELTLPSTLKEIGELAFMMDRGLEKVTCNSPVPPSWEKSLLLPSAGLFDEFVYAQAPLFVPGEAVEAYMNAPGWSQFAEIHPIGWNGLGSVETVKDEEYYDLQGRRLQPPAEGLTIVRDGSGRTGMIHVSKTAR